MEDFVPCDQLVQKQKAHLQRDAKDVMVMVMLHATLKTRRQKVSVVHIVNRLVLGDPRFPFVFCFSNEPKV